MDFIRDKGVLLYKKKGALSHFQAAKRL